jgi:hypothetical protein
VKLMRHGETNKIFLTQRRKASLRSKFKKQDDIFTFTEFCSRRARLWIAAAQEKALQTAAKKRKQALEK